MANDNGPEEIYLPDDLGYEEKPSKKKRILKFLFKIILLLAIVMVGFFVGIYLKIFDANEMNEMFGLHEWPIVGEYFVPPAGQEDEEGNTDEDLDKPITPKKDVAEDVKPKANDKSSQPVKLTKQEIEKQMKEKAAAEKKRVSKLARLYNEMKPADAAEIMNDLDDDTAIAILQRMDESQSAKVLAEFESGRAARLTKIMYSGMKSRVQNGADTDDRKGGEQ